MMHIFKHDTQAEIFRNGTILKCDILRKLVIHTSLEEVLTRLYITEA